MYIFFNKLYNFDTCRFVVEGSVPAKAKGFVINSKLQFCKMVLENQMKFESDKVTDCQFWMKVYINFVNYLWKMTKSKEFVSNPHMVPGHFHPHEK